ncbi:MAG TPA: thioredoxin family protein [Acidobacteriaceae bacterium]|jgi:thiol:disulfide interchange protein
MMTNQNNRRMHAGAVTIALLTLTLGMGCKKQEPAPEPKTVAAATAPDTPEARKAAHMPFTTPPTITKNLYPPISDGPKDVAKGIAEAKREHKRVILDFGGDWCGDCQVLDIYFRQDPNAHLLADNFVKVNVNIGQIDANIDLARKYGMSLKGGVPALAVLDANGKVLYAQTNEFSDMRYMQPQSVTDFLNKWKQ